MLGMLFLLFKPFNLPFTFCFFFPPTAHHLDIQTPTLGPINTPRVISCEQCAYTRTQELAVSKKKNPLAFIRYCGLGSACVKSSLALSAMKRWDTLIGSASVTFPLPWLALLTGCLHLYSLLALVALGGTQEPFGPRGVGLQQRPGPRLTCFNNFLPSSVKLCKYFSPVSLSLERQLRMSVRFSWQLLSRLADSRDPRRSRGAPIVQMWTKTGRGKRGWWGGR